MPRLPFRTIIPTPFIAALALLGLHPMAHGESGEDGGHGGLAISAVLDGYYHHDDSTEGLEALLGEVSGFGHVHAGGEEHHHGPENGFNLNHLELMLSATVDPCFKASAIPAIEADGAELEEATIETTALPGGLALKAGKFASGFGRVNPQHSHEWDFTQGPLWHRLMFGGHGLNDIGVQATWLAPTSWQLLFGGELFQGEDGEFFKREDDSALPGHDGPTSQTAWLKVAPPSVGTNSWQAGLSWGTGKRQEIHDGNGDGMADHWLDGEAGFWGADLVWKHDASAAYGKGDLSFQAEYVRRDMDLAVVRHDLLPFASRHKEDTQDGISAQAVYGFAPRWRAGLRYDRVGMTNETRQPDGTETDAGASDRWSLMVDWSATEFSRLRLGWDHGDYATADGDERSDAVMLQVQVTIGEHGAHAY